MLCQSVILWRVVFQGYPGEDSKTSGPAGPLGEPVGLAFLQLILPIPMCVWLRGESECHPIKALYKSFLIVVLLEV